MSGPTFGEQLRQSTAAVRFMHAKFGARRALKRSERDKAAEAFHATGDSLSASKKIIDTKDPAYKAVTSVISRAKSYWRDITVPYPERGIRLIKRDRVAEFGSKMQAFREELRTAVNGLHAAYDGLCASAREHLGDLFNVSDYPSLIGEEFALDWDFPTIGAPEYLKTLNPALWEAEQSKIEARFNAAVALTEQAFAEELQSLVSHLVDRLKPDENGEQKIFKDKAVTNLKDFFDRFQSMASGTNPALAALVQQAQAALNGESGTINAADLRKSPEMQQRLASSLGNVAEVLDTLLVAKPIRAIVLDDEPTEAAA